MLAVLAYHREIAKSPYGDVVPLSEGVLIGAGMGLVAAATHSATRRLRMLSTEDHYLCWALIGFIAMGVPMGLDLLRSPSSGVVLLWISVGPVMGLGLGWLEQQVNESTTPSS